MPHGSTRPPTPLPPDLVDLVRAHGWSWRRRAGCGDNSTTATGCGKNWRAHAPPPSREPRPPGQART